jgi:hypothetical protein
MNESIELPEGAVPRLISLARVSLDRVVPRLEEPAREAKLRAEAELLERLLREEGRR